MFVLGMLLQLIFGSEFLSTTPSKGKRASLSSTDKLLLLTEVGGDMSSPQLWQGMILVSLTGETVSGFSPEEELHSFSMFLCALPM